MGVYVGNGVIERDNLAASNGSTCLVDIRLCPGKIVVVDCHEVGYRHRYGVID